MFGAISCIWSNAGQEESHFSPAIRFGSATAADRSSQPQRKSGLPFGANGVRLHPQLEGVVSVEVALSAACSMDRTVNGTPN